MSGTYCTFCGNKLIYCNCYGIREAARKAEGPARNEPEQSPPLPQAPLPLAAAPVEEESRWCKSCGLTREWHRPEVAMIGSDGKPCKDFVPQPKTRAPGSQGVEGCYHRQKGAGNADA